MVDDLQTNFTPETRSYELGEPEELTNTSRRSGVNCPLLNQLKKMECPKETDAELVKKYNEGNVNAGYSMLVKHYKFILKRILEITNGHWFSEDILQAGAVGLFEAMKRFDPERGYTFLTYADSWIRKYIYIEVRNELLPMGGIAIGRDAKELLFNYIKLLMQNKTDHEIMETLKIDTKKLNELKIMNITAARIKSLDYVNPDSEDENSADPYSMIEDKGASTVEQVEENDLRNFIENAVKELEETDPLAARIINMKLGINGYPELTRKEIWTELCLKKYVFLKHEKEGNKYLRTKLIAGGFYDKEPES